ncbi:MAG TPA: BatD family protein [Rhodanobacteraceae bacterium]
MKRLWTRQRSVWLLLAACLLLAGVAQAGTVSVHAFLDRTQVALGDTVTLNIQVDGTMQATQPDVSALNADFIVRGTSQSSQMRFVNGHGSEQILWAIALQPRHAGTLVIPPLTVDGHTTQALTLTVTGSPATPHGAPGDPVFIRVKPSTTAPYVGQQVDLDVRLYYVPGVGNGSLDMPQGPAIDLRQVGKDSNYQAQSNGRMYHVLERHYALIVQQAGSITLTPVTFDGQMGGQGGGFFGAFPGMSRQVSAHSAPIALAVRARPKASGKGAWLPARKLTLQLAGWPADGKIQAGQPLTLTLTEKAEGLPFESLPEPRLPKLAGARVYPDQPTSHTGTDGVWLQGTRARKFAVVMQQAGQVTLPAITLPWWNVTTGQPEVATIPARTLTVLPAPGTSTHATAPAAPSAAVAKHATSAPEASVTPGKLAPAAPTTTGVAQSHWLAWIAIALWAVTALLAFVFWWWRRKRRAAPVEARTATSPRPSTRQGQQVFVASLSNADTAAQGAALLAWARMTRPRLRHLGELAANLASPAQREAVGDLERARYAVGSATVDAEKLRAAFAHGFEWRQATADKSSSDTLPPLYPPA